MIRRQIATNLAIAVGLLIAIEAGSWAILFAYDKFRSGPAATATANADQDQKTRYSSNEVSDDLARHADMPGSPYRYESYIVYRNRPFRSKHVNIDESGMRLNGGPPVENPELKIWMLGSSPVFGATSGDDETIPAAIERQLAKSGRRVSVSNFGVVGYTSWQEALDILLRLGERPKPDVVILFTGDNDFQLAWLSEMQRCERLLETAAGSNEALIDAWEARASQRLVAWPVVRAHVASLFSNTIKLAGLTGKYFRLRAANKDPEAWKRGYRERRDRANKITTQCQLRAREIMLRNIQAAALTAKQEGVDFILSPQPIIYTTKKPLAGQEKTIFEHLGYNFFALTDAELDQLKEVPSYRLEQSYVWNLAAFRAGYAEHVGAMRELAGRLGVKFVDATPAIDAAGAVPIFSTTIHFTARGTDIIANEITKAIAAPKRSSP